jgi:hypothetical protein
MVQMALAAPGRFGKFRVGISLRRTTPRVIEIIALTMAVLCVITFVMSLMAISRTGDAVARIGLVTKPSVVTAEKLSVALADMDAAITNSSLGSRGSWWRYVADADTVVAMSVEAGRHLDTGEADALRHMLAKLRTYYQFVGAANALATDNETDQKLPLSMTLWASHDLRQDIIPQTEAMARDANAELEGAYDTYRQTVAPLVIEAAITAGLLWLLMVGAQIFLALRTHRLVNVPLALGSAVLTVFIIGFVFTSFADMRTLQATKEDAFDSILHLYRAKAVSFLMKADESMWLFEQRKARADYAQSFADGSRTVLDIGNASQLALADADRPAPVNQGAIEQLKTALADAERYAAAGNYDAAAKLTPKNIPGYLGEELIHAARHPAERKSATAAISYFLRHIDIDMRLRALEASGHHAEAVRLCIGDNDGGSNWAFQGMNAAIDDIIGLNEARFAADIDTTGRHVVWLIQALTGALLAVILFGGWGLWLRYAEYR